MMESLQHVHGGFITLDASPYEDPGVHSFSSFAPLQQLPYHASHSMSWSTTDPTLFLNEQNWLHHAKSPLSWQTDVNYLHQGMQHNLGGFSAVGQIDMISALNGDQNIAPVNELSLQLYSLYQDHYGDSSPPFNQDTIVAQPDYLLSSTSECLQVVSSSGSDNLSTTETWRSETSCGGFAPNYEQVLANFNELSSVSFVGDAHDCNFLPQKRELDIIQQDVLERPLRDSWIPNQLQAATGRSKPLTAPALTHDVAYDVLPSRSSAALLPLKRPRTWQQVLEQGRSTENDNLQLVLASKTNRRHDYSADPLSRSTPSREIKAPSRHVSNQLLGPGTSVFSKRSNVQDDGRSSNGKITAASVEPQSVAARHRRKKISERIRVLEKLIPGGNKMDTATMLDEAIEYVKFLQLQVRILESEPLDDIPVAAASSKSQSLARKGYGNMDKDGLKRKIHAVSGGDLSAALSLRPATSPLILSEVLQQQLFRKKLCLVSIRQCSPNSASTLTLAPSVLRKRKL